MTDLTVAPVAGRERIESLDVIRGVAILFILFMNIPDMGGFLLNDPRLVSWHGFDRVAYGFQFTLHGTQRGLLQLLFGAGILIMARKAMHPDGPVAVADLHYRRNLLLVVFGLVNALPLFWFGDILLPYGIAAVFLFPARHLRPRTLMLVAALFMAASNIGYVHRYVERAELHQVGPRLEAQQVAKRPVSSKDQDRLKEWLKVKDSVAPLAQSKEKQRRVAEERASRLGSIRDYALLCWGEWLAFFQPIPFFPIMADIIGNMLLGMALFKMGILQGRASRSTYFWMLLIGYGVGFSLRLISLAEVLSFSVTVPTRWLLYDPSRLALTLGHVAALHLLLNTGSGSKLLRPFQAAGRMPLTVYLSASFVTMWVLFPGFGLGLFGRFGSGGLMLIAIAIIVSQIAASNLWLRRYETGPPEWLWKSLAYGARQPYRKSAPVSGVAPAE